MEMAKLLLSFNGSLKTKFNMNLPDISLQWTPVHYCVKTTELGSHENEQMLKLLISHGADPNVKDGSGTQTLIIPTAFVHHVDYVI